MKEIDFEIFLYKGKYRIPVLKKLNEREQVAFLLAKEMKTQRETISRVFKELSEKNLIECLNPNEHHYRKYQITQKGKDILKLLKSK